MAKKKTLPPQVLLPGSACYSTVSVQSEWQLHHPRGFHIPPSGIWLPGSSEQTFPAKVQVWSANQFFIVILTPILQLNIILAKLCNVYFTSYQLILVQTWRLNHVFIYGVTKVLVSLTPLPDLETDVYSQPSIGMTVDHQQPALPQLEPQKKNKHRS